MDTEAYATNVLLEVAAERKFGIIGEAVNRLSKLHPNLAARVTQVRKIVNFRNVLAHGYEHVVPELVWDYARNHLPQLRETVQMMIAELGSLDQ
ncbi:MAG: DUF86 domain-containing protein [Aestuariivita sp.]|nr:DUF86 domain-containing protein [Aestuariivita sp.]